MRLNLDEYKGYISTKISSLQSYEVEARFTEYSQNKGVSLRTYNRLIEYFGANSASVHIISQTDYIVQDVRKTVKDKTDVTWLRKRSIWDTSLPKIYQSYGIKFDINKEEIFTPEGGYTNIFDSNPKVIRVKLRNSYDIIPGGVRLDITRVNMTDESRVETISYEVELELLSITNLDDWINNIKALLQLIQDTEIPYSREEYMSVISHVNITLTGKDSEETPKTLKRGLLVQAKNLKFHHLTSEYMSRYRYRVTIKADGIRKMLVYYKNAFYFVMNPSEVNKLVVFNDDIFEGFLDNMIMEGELITKDSKRKTYIKFDVGKYFYLIFDLLSFKANDKISKLPHTERLSYARNILDNIRRLGSNTVNDILFNGLITIQIKQFKEVNSSEEFFMTIRDLEITKLREYYEDDGYIIMPDNVGYDSLGKPNTDILKWKPSDKLTIDLAISKKQLPSGETINVYSYTYNTKIFSIEFINDKFQAYSFLRGINYSTYSVSYKKEKFSIYCPSLITLDSSDSFLVALFEKNEIIVKGIYSNGKYRLELLSSSDKPKVMSESVLRSKITNKQSIIVEIRSKLVGNSILVSVYSSGSYSLFDRKVEIKSEYLDLSKYPTLTVVEFAWKYDTSSLIPIKIRKDKELPNEKSVADDVWESIINPIELDTLTGDSIQLMRKYHNRIKKRLLNGQVKGIPFIGGNLLDLGSGAGGDVTKWERYEKIICVEPNVEYIKELTKRIRETYDFDAKIYTDKNGGHSDDKIIVINTGAENYDLISYYVNKFFGGKCNVISSMLTLSFFWGGLYEGFIRTINHNLSKGGYFIYLTIDGDLVTQLFDPLLKGPSITSIKLLRGEVVLKYNQEEKKLFIDLPKSVTVKEQTESLVFLDKLRITLASFKELGWYRADQELYMNSSERILSSLYSYGGFFKIM